MCGGFACGVTTSVIGAVFVVVSAIVGYVVVPNLIDGIIVDQVTLINDTIQMERFEEVPFPLNFTVRLWNISNVAEVENGGIPDLREAGPYVYQIYQRRVVESIDEDELTYRIIMNFEFDDEASYPNTLDDIVHVVNVPYHAILQVASVRFPELMPALSLGLNGIFGANNSPFLQVRVRDLLMDGIRICDSPGLIGAVACTQVRSLSADSQNLAEQEDGSLLFSLLGYSSIIKMFINFYRNGNLSPRYVVHRGLQDDQDLARIIRFNERRHLLNWVDDDGIRGSGLCNMINGTDSAIFAPFIDREKSLFALNTDICRSVELRYQYDTEHLDIPAVRFAVNEWFLDNNEGCFCLNSTSGINQPNGCLLAGTMELYSCVGAFLVLSYPHFLYADPRYRNGVLGMTPNEEIHRIFLDIEPNTGTVLRGGKRAQFNIFSRPIQGIAATQSLNPTLVPIMWIEEGMALPEEFADEIKSRLLLPLTIVSIVFPIIIAISALALLIGLFLIYRARNASTNKMETMTPGQTILR